MDKVLKNSKNSKKNLPLFCIDLIEYVYHLYNETLRHRRTITSLFTELEEKFGILHPRFLFLSNHVLEVMGFKMETSMLLIGITGVLAEDPKKGIIAFRGTKNVSEWMKNIDFLQQTKYTPNIISNISEEIKKDAKLARGFYSLYTAIPPGPSFNVGCHCVEPCGSILSAMNYVDTNPFSRLFAQRLVGKLYKEKTGCSTYNQGYVSKIGPECPTSPFLHIDCSSPLLSKPQSLRTQVAKYVEEMVEAYGVKKVVVCGHSLGGVFAQLVALDVKTITKAMTQKNDKNVKNDKNDKNDKNVKNVKNDIDLFKVITFGSPRIGNSTFVQIFNKHVPLKKNYRYANIEDTVVNLPLPFSVMTCYAHTGTTKHTFSDLSILQGECGHQQVKTIHSLQSYRSYIEKH